MTSSTTTAKPTPEQQQEGGVDSATDSVADPVDHAVEDLIVISKGEAIPGCSPRDVALRIMTFLDAFNQGDQEQLRQLFFASGVEETEYGPVGYILGETLSRDEDGMPLEMWRPIDTDDVDTLLAYFAGRFQQGEQMRLVMVEVHMSEDSDPRRKERAGFVFVVARRAPDLGDGPEHVAMGKGVLNCQEQKFFLWSMGSVPATSQWNQWPGMYKGCAAPPAALPTEHIIACDTNIRLDGTVDDLLVGQ